MYLIKALGPGLLLCAVVPFVFVLALPFVRRPGRHTFLTTETAATAIGLVFTLLVGMGEILGMRELISIGVPFTQALLIPPAVMSVLIVFFWVVLRTGKRLSDQPPASGPAAR